MSWGSESADGAALRAGAAASREEALALLRSGDAVMMVGLMESAALNKEFDFTRMVATSRYALVSRSKRGQSPSRT